MIKNKEWDNFLNNLLNNAIEKYKETTEYEYIKKQQEEIDMLLNCNLTSDEKELVEECLFDIGLICERETEIVYKQGMKDCVCILKNLGVLA
jgi:hypothetical protein